MSSRREMGALCASLLFCLLLSLGAGWAQSQLITADQLAADTLRLHIRADTDSVRDQSAKLAVRDAVLVLTDEAAIGMVNSKTTAVRVIPAIGRKAGEVLDFGGLLGYGPIMPVNQRDPSVFINRGGRLPAPMQSLKN